MLLYSKTSPAIYTCIFITSDNYFHAVKFRDVYKDEIFYQMFTLTCEMDYQTRNCLFALCS